MKKANEVEWPARTRKNKAHSGRRGSRNRERIYSISVSLKRCTYSVTSIVVAVSRWRLQNKKARYASACPTLMWFAEPGKYMEKWKGARPAGGRRAEGIRWQDGDKRRREFAPLCHVPSAPTEEKRRRDEKREPRARRWPLNATRVPNFPLDHIPPQRRRIVSGEEDAATRKRRRKDGGLVRGRDVHPEALWHVIKVHPSPLTSIRGNTMYSERIQFNKYSLVWEQRRCFSLNFFFQFYFVIAWTWRRTLFVINRHCDIRYF